MTPEELAAIRERAEAYYAGYTLKRVFGKVRRDVENLLAHIATQDARIADLEHDLALAQAGHANAH